MLTLLDFLANILPPTHYCHQTLGRKEFKNFPWGYIFQDKYLVRNFYLKKSLW